MADKVMVALPQPPVRPSRPLRVLVISHSHPHLTNGGAEIAAYRLYEGLRDQAGVEAWFLGCDPQGRSGRDGVAITQPFGERDYLYSGTGQFYWFKFANRDPRLPAELTALLEDLAPDVVHLHHYANLGVEVLRLIRTLLPDCRIVVTLHEFQAICNHFGQMVKRGQFALCDQARADACSRCFPEQDRADFFIREQYIKLFFQHVDMFISPSHFLRGRYVDWGISAERITVIENIVAARAIEISPAASTGLARGLRIGFFGQISRLKGINVVMECARLLHADGNTNVIIEIFGDYHNQPLAFQEEFLIKIETLSSNVVYRGAYRQAQVDQLMSGVDAVMVPSIWWENSPVVIQEAFRNNRPVVCSDIGGMAEKVRHELDGFHFSSGSALALKQLLEELAADPAKVMRVRDTMSGAVDQAGVMAGHLEVYR